MNQQTKDLTFDATWSLKLNAYDKRVIPKDGLVFELSIHDGRKAIGIVLCAKFGDLRAPLIEILSIAEQEFDYGLISQAWIDEGHKHPFLPPIAVDPAIFSKLQMAKRIGVYEAPESIDNIYVYQGFASLDTAARMFIPDKREGKTYTKQNFNHDLEDWSVIDKARKFHRLGDLIDWESKLLVPANVPFAGTFDLFFAQMLAFDEGKKIPSIERSKLEHETSR